MFSAITVVPAKSNRIVMFIELLKSLIHNHAVAVNSYNIKIVIADER